MSKYVTSFKNVGASYDESLLLLNELNKRSWNEIEAATHEENLLKKRSSKWIEMLLRTAWRRYFESHAPLPEVKDLTRFLLKINSRQAKIQTLFQYICASHPLVDHCVIDLVGVNLKQYGTFRLTKTIFRDFFSEEAKVHSELEAWADYTKDKWRRDFFAFLRSSSLMESHPNVFVKNFVIKPETFAFFLYGLLENRIITSELFNAKIWKRYFLTYEDIEEKLSECQVRGWLKYRSRGGIHELIPKFKNLEMWINAIKS